MKKKITLLVTLILMMLSYVNAKALTIQYDGITTEYSGSLFDLKVNGVTPYMPLSPLIFNDRALVPVREVFENLGARVEYNDTDKSVNIFYYDNRVTLYVDKEFAYVNGKKTVIPDGVTPKLINVLGEAAKTMVPVRFISESLNILVEFSDNTIHITNGEGAKTDNQTPQSAPAQQVTTPVTPSVVQSGKSQILSVTYTGNGGGVVAEITTSSEVGKVDVFHLTDPSRIVLDISNAVIKTSSMMYDVNQGGVSKIRLGEHDNMSRIVFDLTESCTVNVNKSGSNLIVYINPGNTDSVSQQVQSSPVNNTQITTPPASSNQNTSTRPGDITHISAVVFSNEAKAIVLDAGHGGIDSGAVGNLNGIQIKESDLTLSIVQRTRDILKEKGYTVILTRDCDEYPTLTARAEFANESNAAIFVSVHINSATAETAHGTEVYYADENNGDAYGLKSSELANELQYNLVQNLGFRDRGVKMANHAVTRRSLMPAALVEIGFISNAEELSKMVTDEYLQKSAVAIADSIVSIIDRVNIPQQ